MTRNEPAVSVILAMLLFSFIAACGTSEVPQAAAHPQGEAVRLFFHHDGRTHHITPDRACHQTAVEKIIALLETSDDTFDMAVHPDQLKTWRVEKSWAELVFDQPVQVTVGYVRQTVKLSRMLLFFKNERPEFIFFATDEYTDDHLAANTGADRTMFETLIDCTPNDR